MAVIKSGASTDNLTVDPTSKAARVTLYDSLGQAIVQKATYRAATTAVLVPAVTVNIPWLIIAGSATKTVRVQRIQISGLTLTAVAYLHVNLAKYSTNATGGTSTTLTAAPLDSNSAAATAVVKAYTAVPTAGNKVGDLASKRFMGQATTAAAAGITDFVDFDFRGVGGETSAIVLRGTTQELALYWQTAPATTVSMLAEIEFTEE